MPPSDIRPVGPPEPPQGPRRLKKTNFTSKIHSWVKVGQGGSIAMRQGEHSYDTRRTHIHIMENIDKS